MFVNIQQTSKITHAQTLSDLTSSSDSNFCSANSSICSCSVVWLQYRTASCHVRMYHEYNIKHLKKNKCVYSLFTMMRDTYRSREEILIGQAKFFSVVPIIIHIVLHHLITGIKEHVAGHTRYRVLQIIH